MEYKEKREKKLERFRELKQKAQAGSRNAYETSNKLASVIPMGQPILVGHHSEKSHHSHLKRIHNQMDKSVELSNRAEYYENRIKSMENNNTISSDDPKAIEKLKEKVSTLKENQETMKKVNAHYKKNKSFDGLDVPEHVIKAGKSHINLWGGVHNGKPFPTYCLTNNNSVIKTCEDRIKILENNRKQETKEYTIKNIKIVENVEDNRIQLFFEGIPSVETRTELKSNGFKWSGFNGCWQRFLNNTGRYSTKRFLDTVEVV